MTTRLFVGTYAHGGGAGLHALELADDGTWSTGAASPVVRNASFGTYSSRHDLYYFVDEQSGGAVGAFRDAPDGWQQLARAATLGEEPCYVALDPSETLLAVANYGSGSVAVYRLDADGLPVAPPVLLQNTGHGANFDRQDGPHAHCACFGPDGTWLYVADLGTDAVLAFPVDPATGTLGARKLAFAAPAGSGPRHLVFHPDGDVAILLSELASTLTVFDVAGGDLRVRETVSTLPHGFSGTSLGGHLSLDAAGDRVYVTNRGHDSVAVFALDAAGGLALLQHLPSGGASPRSFVVLEAERQLVLANEQACTITAFDLAADGMLTRNPTDLAIPGAVFLLVAAR